MEGHEFRRLARIEEIGHPRRLTAFHALAVKLVAGSQKKHETITELLEFQRESIRQRKGCRGDAPFLFMKETTLGHGGTDGTGRFKRAHERIFSAWRINSSEVGISSPVFITARIALWASTCL